MDRPGPLPHHGDIVEGHAHAGTIADCPFCGARWTPAMLAQLDAMSGPATCACCAGGRDVAPLPVPTGDLCCERCGRAIFSAPSSLIG